ncbi:MAG: T9SS type A sorting domain-containing protein [Candidatus Kapaibacterium sp.]
MKKIILIITFLFLTLSLSADVWQRVNGAVEKEKIYSIFNLNGESYVSTKQNGNLILEDDNWVSLNSISINEFGLISSVTQKENLVLLCSKNGIFLSQDYGENWRKIESLNGYKELNSIICANGTFYAQVSKVNSSLYRLNIEEGIWEKLYTNSDKSDSVYADLIVTDGNIIYAGDTNYNKEHGTHDGIKYSEDYGDTWKEIEFNEKGLISMVYHNGHFIVGASDNHVYRTTDRGGAWLVDTNNLFPVMKFHSFGDVLFGTFLTNSPDFKDTLGIYRSTDDGQTWIKSNNGILTPRVIIYSDSKEGVFTLADDGTLYLTRNKGESWEEVTPKTDKYIVPTVKLISDTLFSVAGNNGIIYSTDYGNNWYNYSPLLSTISSSTTSFYKKDGILIAPTPYGNSFYLSLDYGNNWRYESTGPFILEGWMSDFLIKDSIIIVSSVTEISRISKDLGKTWDNYTEPNLDTNIRLYKFLNNKEEYFAVSDSGIYKNLFDSDDLKFIKSEIPINSLNLMFDEGKIYYFNLDKELFTSTNYGLEWESINITYNVEGRLQRAFVENGIIYITSSLGLIISQNNGISWEEFFIESDGTNLTFLDLAVHNEYLIAGTRNGIYRAKLSDLGIEVKSSVESEIERNYLYTYPPYPNPAKSEVKVLFYWDINLPMTTDDISIYDITGKKIDATDKISIVKQENHYGNLIWDCSSAQPGIYLINIKHGTEEKAVKVVVE